MFLISYLLEYNRYCNLVGIAAILGIAWLFSRHRTHINLKLIVNALLLQFAIAFFTLKTSVGHFIFSKISEAIASLYGFANVGTSFIFGNLTNASQSWGFIFAINVLPIIIFFGAFMAVLFHLKIVQAFVGAISWMVRPILGTSGAETLCAISNSFLGQTEAPLLVKNYLGGMTKSEMLVVMISGMATISGAILVVFAAMGVPAQHLLAASVMAIPGSLLISKMLYPETEVAQTASGASVSFEKSETNIFGAIAQGTIDGMYLALNVGAMLISFLALIALLNSIIAYVGLSANGVLAYLGIGYVLPNLSLNVILSYLFAPFSYLLGFTGSEALVVGRLLGTKMAVNELIAYGSMVKEQLSPRTVAIMTYALCGFANFSCIGIQIGGIGGLVPNKRQWLSELGLLAVLGGSLSNLLSAAIAGLLL